MNGELYQDAVIPKPHTVLGLRLKPYCIGHRIILGRINSPFVLGTKAGIHDLVLAVYVCSMSWEDGLASFEDAKIEKRMKAWIKQLGNIDWAQKMADFRKYIAYHSRCYDFSALGESSSVSFTGGTPLDHEIIVVLMSRLGLSESESFNRCYSLALMDYAVIKEQDGKMRVRDAEKMNELMRGAAEIADLLKRGEAIT